MHENSIKSALIVMRMINYGETNSKVIHPGCLYGGWYEAVKVCIFMEMFNFHVLFFLFCAYCLKDTFYCQALESVFSSRRAAMGL